MVLHLQGITFDSWALGAGLIPIKTPNVFNQIMKVRFVNTIENKLPESNKPILNYFISLFHTKRYKVLFRKRVQFHATSTT